VSSGSNPVLIGRGGGERRRRAYRNVPDSTYSIRVPSKHKEIHLPLGGFRSPLHRTSSIDSADHFVQPFKIKDFF
jgi:hypothetical protein